MEAGFQRWGEPAWFRRSPSLASPEILPKDLGFVVLKERDIFSWARLLQADFSDSPVFFPYAGQLLNFAKVACRYPYSNEVSTLLLYLQPRNFRI